MENAAFSFLNSFAFPEPVHVTRPVLPSLDAYRDLLATIWDSRSLTNNGLLHQRLEKELSAYLGVDHVNVFCNGTIALLVALQALGIQDGEVITTPFTFPATPHALHWNRVQPVFGDIDPETFNLDPRCLPDLITPKTRAIMPVHVYGTPCDVDGIDAIAKAHGIAVIYDAAHAMGVRFRGRSLASFGDMAMLSFHATKLFTTGEGGALVSHTAALERSIYFLKNFGIANEEEVVQPGINGKMTELQAALGLLEFELLQQEIENRRVLLRRYRDTLREIPGISFPAEVSGTETNAAYCPILIDADRFGMTRDAVNDALRSINVYPRKYFYPLCSHFPSYRDLPSAAPARLAVAERVASQVLCLPLYGELPAAAVDRICAAIGALHKRRS